MMEVFWSQFHFMRPLWLLVAIPAIVLLIIRYRREQTSPWQDSLPAHLSKALSVGESGWQRQLPLRLLTVLFAIFIIIAAGPTWQRQPSPFGEDKAPLLIVLDVSDSMQQTDVQPNRLERSKQKILDILSIRNGGSTGLIVYAGSAHVAMPLTEDKAVFEPLLNAISLKIMPRAGKFAEYSIDVIEQEFSTQPQVGTVLLITDGLSANTIPVFDDYFSLTSHQLLVLAVGNEQATSEIPADFAGLSRLAAVADGEMIMMTVDEDDVETIVSRVNRHMMLNVETAMPWQDMGYGLVFVITGCFLLWFRKGWLVQWCFILSLTSGLLAPMPVSATTWSFIDLWLTKDQQGYWHFQQQDYLKAAEDFINPLWKATAYYHAKEYAKAHSYFMREDSVYARMGAANSLAYQREFVAARNLYRDIVAEEPDYPNARHNLAVLQKLIDEINQMSASQNTENDASKELGDAPLTSDGAEQLTTSELMVSETLSAEQLLQDDALNDKWMKRVQSDPARFLRSKFEIQLQQRKYQEKRREQQP